MLCVYCRQMDMILISLSYITQRNGPEGLILSKLIHISTWSLPVCKRREKQQLILEIESSIANKFQFSRLDCGMADSGSRILFFMRYVLALLWLVYVWLRWKSIKSSILLMLLLAPSSLFPTKVPPSSNSIITCAAHTRRTLLILCVFLHWLKKDFESNLAKP